MLLIAITACNRTPLEKYKAVVEDVEANYESYTPEDWDAVEGIKLMLPPTKISGDVAVSF